MVETSIHRSPGVDPMKRRTLSGELERNGTLVADGATGSTLQELLRDTTGDTVLPHGCPDGLTLSHPAVVRELHLGYLHAGSDIILTNTFGACPFTLEPFGLANKAAEINSQAARIARQAVEDHGSGLVIGSVGPGSLLPSLRQVSFRDLMDAYSIQISGLVEGGVDGILVETCQDPLQTKAALAAIRALSPNDDPELPVIVSFTVENRGTMLLGTSIDAMITTVLPYRPTLIGLNCGAGPEVLEPFLGYLCSISPVPVWFKPNAGTPRLHEDRVVFQVDPTGFAKKIVELLRKLPLSVVGGCCGTTADHIREIRNLFPSDRPTWKPHSWEPSLSSLYDRVFYAQEDSPLLIGERGNVNGSRKFRRIMEKRDFETAVSLITRQATSGAHAVDVCVDSAETDPREDLTTMARCLRGQCRMPIFLDSATPDALIRAAEELPGRGVLNSVGFEGGDADFRRMAEACRRTGCAMVVLAVDEEGQALTVDGKIAIAARAVKFGQELGLASHDIFFDPLTFPIGTGQAELRTAGAATLSAIEILSREFPGMPSILGVSNISHGLAPPVRKVLNSIMLQLAFQRGLKAAIVHPGQIEPLHTIDADVRAHAQDLLLHGASSPAIKSFLALFGEDHAHRKKRSATPPDPLEVLKNRVIDGDMEGLELHISKAVDRFPPEVVLSNGILGGMEEVGELFKRGEMQIPFVLASAEVVRKASELIAPLLPVSTRHEKQSVVLATVEGDVHDIGKNLVGIILQNNGYTVHDLGIRIPIIKAFKTAIENGSMAIGLSGLLVQSVAVMRRGIEQIASMGPPYPPIVVGGAALNHTVVEQNLAPLYPGSVSFAKDAMEGLEIIRNFKQGTEMDRQSRTDQSPKIARKSVDIPNHVPVPKPPFTGSKIETDIHLESCVETLNPKGLFRRFWKLNDDIESERLLEKFIYTLSEAGVSGSTIWGFYRTRSTGNSEISITDPGTGISVSLDLGRQEASPFRSIADYLNPQEDYAALFMATMGIDALSLADDMRRRGNYRDYFLLHGLIMALTEALTERTRRAVRHAWGFEKNRGKAYAPGMPAFPDITVHESFFAVLNPKRIGISHTETWSLIPECSASGLVIHHPDAEYF